MFEQYEDVVRLHQNNELVEFISTYQDFRYYNSSVTPGIRLAMNVIKPEQPGWVLIQLHGWHMSMPKPERREHASESPYLIVQVDMRGRAFSEGQADCNGFELYDIYDAVQFVLREYSEYLCSSDVVYLEGGSGGGGNVLATLGKFPDLFAAATALYGISDYAVWYKQDQKGEFRDEMDVWIGCSPDQNLLSYQVRSGLFLARNVMTPLYLAHGDGDIRVPVTHSRNYVEAMHNLGKQHLVKYNELKGVGGQRHTTHITQEQVQELENDSELNRSSNRYSIQLPSEGKLIVGGFIVTKHFSMLLEQPCDYAEIEYNLESKQVRFLTPYIGAVTLDWYK